jgi:2-iminoacetate synthase ThiH
VTTLALRAIAEAGLGELAEARRVGDLERVRELSPLLEAADLLALGALADRIRAEEVGDDVLVFTRLSPHLGGDVITVGATEAGGGRAEVLRRVAIARITGSRAARVRVDWATVGIEIAQVALGFGASELQGPVLNRRGLPIAEESARKVKGAGLVSLQSLKKKELFALVRMAGRTPIAAVEGSPMPQLASPEAP